MPERHDAESHAQSDVEREEDGDPATPGRQRATDEPYGPTGHVALLLSRLRRLRRRRLSSPDRSVPATTEGGGRLSPAGMRSPRQTRTGLLRTVRSKVAVVTTATRAELRPPAGTSSRFSRRDRRSIAGI